MKYLIVLFKNKERKKIIKKFKTLSRAKEFFKSKVKDSNYIFDKRIENGKDCIFELGLLEKDSLIFDHKRVSTKKFFKISIKTQ